MSVILVVSQKDAVRLVRVPAVVHGSVVVAYQVNAPCPIPPKGLTFGPDGLEEAGAFLQSCKAQKIG